MKNNIEKPPDLVELMEELTQQLEDEESAAASAAGNPRRRSAAVPILVEADRFVRIKLFAALTGYSEGAVRGKIADGVWLQGVHYLKAPDGNIVIDREAYRAWCRGEQQTGK